MKITDQQLDRFSSMVRDFARKHGIGVTIETDTIFMEKTDVCFNNAHRFKRYTVIWKETKSLTEAGTTIFVDALNFFGIKTGEALEFEIKDVIFNNPATIVLWADGTKTVVKCQEDDVYSEEVGLALCFAKKALGNKSNFNNVFKKWIPEGEPVQFKPWNKTDTPVIRTDHIGDFVKNFLSGNRKPVTETEVK